MALRPPSREQRRDALRAIYRGRVRLLAMGPLGCAAEVVGSEGDVYCVTFAGGEWDCDCPLLAHRPSWRCYHIAAVELIWRTIEAALKGEGTDAVD